MVGACLFHSLGATAYHHFISDVTFISSREFTIKQPIITSMGCIPAPWLFQKINLLVRESVHVYDRTFLLLLVLMYDKHLGIRIMRRFLIIFYNIMH